MSSELYFVDHDARIGFGGCVVLQDSEVQQVQRESCNVVRVQYQQCPNILTRADLMKQLHGSAHEKADEAR